MTQKIEWKRIDQSAPTDRVDFIREWVRKLCDPASRQGKGFLMRKNGNACCFGIACDVFGLEKRLEKDLDETYVYVFGDDDDKTLLPVNLVHFLSIDNEEGRFVKYNRILEKYDHLVEANDNGVPFVKIARAICTYPNSIFKDLTEEERSYIINVILPEVPTWEAHLAARKALREQAGKDSGEAKPT